MSNPTRVILACRVDFPHLEIAQKKYPHLRSIIINNKMIFSHQITKELYLTGEHNGVA